MESRRGGLWTLPELAGPVEISGEGCGAPSPRARVPLTRRSGWTGDSHRALGNSPGKAVGDPATVSRRVPTAPWKTLAPWTGAPALRAGRVSHNAHRPLFFLDIHPFAQRPRPTTRRRPDGEQQKAPRRLRVKGRGATEGRRATCRALEAETSRGDSFAAGRRRERPPTASEVRQPGASIAPLGLGLPQDATDPRRRRCGCRLGPGSSRGRRRRRSGRPIGCWGCRRPCRRCRRRRG